MRGPSSRLAAVALALSLGAAGARSLGAVLPSGAASCSRASPDATSNHLATLPEWREGGSGALGWRGTDPERTGSTPDDKGPRRGARIAAPRGAWLSGPLLAGTQGLSAQRTRGLLGLAGTPANAPPGS